MRALKQNPDICFRMFCSAVADGSVDRIILYGVRYLNVLDKPVTEKDLQNRRSFYDAILTSVAKVEPAQFVRIFLITKNYTGNRNQSKDYFSTIEMINQRGWNTPIGSAFEFLWDYENWETRIFLANYLSLLSDIRRCHGQSGIAEEWCRENGIQTHTMHTDFRGKKFIMDEHGRTRAVRKPRPRYLRLLRKSDAAIERK